jgi:hypothetical protein
MYRYKKENQLVTSAIPLQGLTLVTLSDEDAKYFVGFDTTGKAVIDKNKFAEIEKQKRVNEINTEFDRQCSKSVLILKEINFNTMTQAGQDLQRRKTMQE